MSGTHGPNEDESPIGSTWMLVAGPFIALSMRLAERLGHQEAMFLQHLHYWLNYKQQNEQQYPGHRFDGRLWIYWTHDELVREIPLGRSASAHKRIVKRLKALGVLLVQQHRSSAWDQTCHYSIDYPVLAGILERVEVVDESNSTISSDRPVAKQPLDVLGLGPSTRSVDTDHMTESSAVISPENSTTTGLTGSMDQMSCGGGGELDVTEVPEAIREAVIALIAGRPDGQRFIDLLTYRMKRAADDPRAGRLVAPLLWLKAVLESENPDFTGADFIEEDRKVKKARRVHVANQQIQELAEQAAQAEARARRQARAALKLAGLSEADLATLREATVTSVLPPRTITTIKDAIMMRVLPEHPFALGVVLKAIERLWPDDSIGNQDAAAC